MSTLPHYTGIVSRVLWQSLVSRQTHVTASSLAQFSATAPGDNIVITNTDQSQAPGTYIANVKHC